MEGRSQHPRHVILTLERSPRFVYIVFLLSARSDSCAHLRRIYSQKEKRKFVRLVVLRAGAVAVLLLLFFGDSKWSRVRTRRRRW